MIRKYLWIFFFPYCVNPSQMIDESELTNNQEQENNMNSSVEYQIVE